MFSESSPPTLIMDILCCLNADKNLISRLIRSLSSPGSAWCWSRPWARASSGGSWRGGPWTPRARATPGKTGSVPLYWLYCTESHYNFTVRWFSYQTDRNWFQESLYLNIKWIKEQDKRSRKNILRWLNNPHNRCYSMLHDLKQKKTFESFPKQDQFTFESFPKQDHLH